MALFAGNNIKWAPGKHIGIDALDTNESTDGFWAYAAQTQYPTSSTSYYSSPKWMQTIAHPRLKPNDSGIVVPSFHSNTSSVDLALANELELKAYPRNHGREKWVCFASSTVNIVCPYPDTIVYTTGNIQVTQSGNAPETLSESLTQGEEYWADKPVTFIAPGEHFVIAPVTLCGNTFIHYSSRYGATTFYIYAVDNADFIIYENEVDGIGGSPTHQISIGAGDFYEHTTSSVDPQTNYITSNGRLVITAKEVSGDNMVVPPTSHVIFTQRRATHAKNLINIGVDEGYDGYSYFDVTNTGHVKYTLGATMIGDGAGGDAMMGMPLENLSNTYVYGTQSGGLSDYFVGSASEQTVYVYYLDANDKWVLFTEHQFTGVDIFTVGPAGVSGPSVGGIYEDSGSASYFLIDDYTPFMWKWEALYPFYVTINDTSDDEEQLFGWCEQRTAYTNGPWPLVGDFLYFVDNFYYNWLYLDYQE